MIINGNESIISDNGHMSKFIKFGIDSMLMKDTIRYQVPIKRSVYQELKIESFKEGKQINEFVKPQIEEFENSLIVKLANIKETRKKQEENARVAEVQSSESIGLPVVQEERVF